MVEYFPGANTPKGFYSYYDYILKSREAKRIIILKGGPGTGKSTFMKSIAKHLETMGYETELLHCSSDPNSLDGVCAREIGFLILDGTSPHIVDPKCPGAVDEIINLGDFWDKKGILKHKDEIIETNEKISFLFKKAYMYLKSAKSLEKEEISAQYELEELSKELSVNKISSNKGFERKAFLSAITPIGKVDYSNTFINKADKVYKVKNSKAIMNGLKDLFINCGHDIRTFYCPMSPDEKIDHIYANGIFFTVENEINVINKDLYNKLLDNAEEMIKTAKEYHDKLEEFYVPYMDFDKVRYLCDDVINTI